MKTANQSFREAPEAAATPASALIAFVLGFTGLPAIIMGHIALARIKNSPRRLNGKFFAVVGIITGWISMITMTVVAAMIALGIAAIPQAWAASDATKNENALSTATELKASLEAFYAEYETYPFPKTFAVGKTAESGNELMTVLTGYEGATKDPLNPKDIAFFKSQEAQTDWLGMPVNGLKVSDDKVVLYDPWGKLYYIKLNAKTPGDDTITTTVWSLGRDRKDGTADDILLSN